jgi:glutamate-ammonia-ligase adenylyltransferase
VPQGNVDLLTRAYRAYRARIHRLSLDAAAPIVPAEEFTDIRAPVTALWDATMCADGQGARV